MKNVHRKGSVKGPCEFCESPTRMTAQFVSAQLKRRVYIPKFDGTIIEMEIHRCHRCVHKRVWDNGGKMMIEWRPSWKKESRLNGKPVEPYSPAWRKAFTAIGLRELNERLEVAAGLMRRDKEVPPMPAWVLEAVKGGPEATASARLADPPRGITAKRIVSKPSEVTLPAKFDLWDKLVELRARCIEPSLWRQIDQQVKDILERMKREGTKPAWSLQEDGMNARVPYQGRKRRV